MNTKRLNSMICILILSLCMAGCAPELKHADPIVPPIGPPPRVNPRARVFHEEIAGAGQTNFVNSVQFDGGLAV